MPKQLNYGYWRTDKPKEAGFSHEFISAQFKEIEATTTLDELKVEPYPGIDTLYKALYRRANDPRMSQLPMMGTRVGDKYEWMNAKEVASTARQFGAGCIQLGLLPELQAEGKAWKFIGIKAKNRKEWGLIHTANMHTGTTTVALYDTLGLDATKYIINLTEMATIATTSDMIKGILTMREDDDKLPESERSVNTLKFLIYFDETCNKEDMVLADKLGIKLYSFNEILNQGAYNKEWKPVEPTPDDCYMFSFTSGTTGNPKGVKLTHKMMVQTATCINWNFGRDIMLGEDDVYISYLPYAHIFE